ncbi:hypothetical protein [Aquimarina sp. LLG6339-5]|uniref:hypothetical protein n=1 Tax=Aquimarina sp. LLG6339-5 TaxID=3160830 RepID=UPI00386DCD95
MKKLVLIAFIMGVSNFCSAQIPYFDIPGLISRYIEQNNAQNLQRQSLRTNGSFAATAVTAGLEKPSRVRFNTALSSLVYINYLEYNTMCNSYINPFKKSKCQNKYNYLKSAHQKVLLLVTIPTLNQVNRGVQEQITEKYIHITNTILKELETLKIQVEKDNFYTRLLLDRS